MGRRTIPVYYEKDTTTVIGFAEIYDGGEAKIELSELLISGVSKAENAITLSAEGFTIK